MIGRWISPFRREATWILFLTSVVVLSLAVIHLKRTAAAAHVRLLPLADWRLGATRLAFCSEQAASFRGWDLRAGPIQLYYLGRMQASKPSETTPPAAELAWTNMDQRTGRVDRTRSRDRDPGSRSLISNVQIGPVTGRSRGPER